MSETNDEPVKGFALLGFKPEALEAKGLPDEYRKPGTANPIKYAYS